MRPLDEAKKDIVTEDKQIEKLEKQARSLSLWYAPTILVGVFIFISFAIIWLIQINIHATKLNQLVSKAESTTEIIRQQLKGNQDYLLMIAKERSNGFMDIKTFQERASQYVTDHPEMICINWVDADYLITDVAPIIPNKQIVGLRLNLPESKRAAHLARKKRQPVYTHPFVVIQGELAFELWVPVFRDSVFLGLFGGIYSYEKMLHSLVCPQVLKTSCISVVNTSGEVLMELPATGTTDEKLVHLTPLTLPENGVSLQFKGYGSGVLDRNLLLLEFLCLAFLIGIVYAIWRLRHTSEVSKRAEEALFEKQQVFRTLVENSPDIIARYDFDCRRTYVNPAYLKAAQMPQEELLITSQKQLSPLPAASAEVLQNLLRKVLDSGVAEDVDVIWPKEDNINYWYNVYAFPEFDREGKVMSVMTVSRDITNHKQTEESLIKAKEHAEESDRLKSAFLANMSHEIRTPMNGILGFTDLLKTPNLKDEEQQEYIRIIEKSSNRLLNTINEIIDISKIESGQMNVNISASNINEQTEYIYNFFMPEVKGKGIQLGFKNSLQAEEAIIKTDHEKISAILINLVKNSIKFTKEGSIEFGYEKKGKYIEFFVKDTGIGIPKDRQEAIFERFIQADIGDKMAFQGTGLGLSISKAYVQMLGGKIWLESEEGKGSTFYFTIPYIINSFV